MTSRRFSRRFEASDKQQQRDCCQRQPRNDAEAIHERQKTDLMLQLLVDIAVRGGGRVRTRKSFRHQVVRHITDPACQLQRGSADGGPKVALMKLIPALRCGGDKGDAKTTSPIPEKIRQAGSPVVLVRPELRPGEHVDGHEEESVTETLISPGQRIVRVIGRRGEGAEVPHGRANSRNADREQNAGGHKLALDQLRCNRGKQRNDQRTRAQYESGVHGPVSVERLKNLWNECCASEEPDSEYE